MYGTCRQANLLYMDPTGIASAFPVVSVHVSEFGAEVFRVFYLQNCSRGIESPSIDVILRLCSDKTPSQQMMHAYFLYRPPLVWHIHPGARCWCREFVGTCIFKSVVGPTCVLRSNMKGADSQLCSTSVNVWYQQKGCLRLLMFLTCWTFI